MALTFASPERGFALLAIEEVGTLTQGHLAQPSQVPFCKKVRHRRLHALRRIDFSRLQPIQKIFGGKVDVHDLVRLRDYFIWDPFFDPDAGRVFDNIIERLQMLNVNGADDIYSHGQQILNVFVPFAILAPGRVGVSQFIDQRHRRLACKQRIEIHFPQSNVVIFNRARRYDLQIANLCGRLRAIVWLDIPDHHVHATLLQPVAFHQHFVRFSDTR